MVSRVTVDLAATPELRSFQDEVRTWLSENLRPEFRGPRLVDPTAADHDEFQLRRQWQRILHQGGWAGVHWPREYGGRSASLLEQAIFLQESAEAGAVEPVNTIALSMVGPTIIEHGTAEQRQLLPSMLSADDIWCQLFSEPDAGSDLGNVATRAERVEDGWRVSGQKVWTSWGEHADRGLLLARTSTSQGGAGLSCFLMDMRNPGVDVRPLRQMSGESHFSEVYLDDVRLPDDALLGREGHGWRVAMSTLVSERTTAIFSRHAHTIHAADALLDLATRHTVEAADTDLAVRLWSEAQLLRIAAYDGVRRMAADADAEIPPSLLVQRLQWGLTTRAIMELGQRLSADAGERDQDASRWRHLMLASRGWTIGGGTSEIQRNMLADRVLGLPRHRRVAAPGAAR